MPTLANSQASAKSPMTNSSMHRGGIGKNRCYGGCQYFDSVTWSELINLSYFIRSNQSSLQTGAFVLQNCRYPNGFCDIQKGGAAWRRERNLHR